MHGSITQWWVAVLIVVLLVIYAEGRGDAYRRPAPDRRDDAADNGKKPKVLHPNTPEFEDMVRKIRAGELTREARRPPKRSPNFDEL